MFLFLVDFRGHCLLGFLFSAVTTKTMKSWFSKMNSVILTTCRAENTTSSTRRRRKIPNWTYFHLSLAALLTTLEAWLLVRFPAMRFHCRLRGWGSGQAVFDETRDAGESFPQLSLAYDSRNHSPHQAFFLFWMLLWYNMIPKYTNRVLSIRSGLYRFHPFRSSSLITFGMAISAPQALQSSYARHPHGSGLEW